MGLGEASEAKQAITVLRRDTVTNQPFTGVDYEQIVTGMRVFMVLDTETNEYLRMGGHAKMVFLTRGAAGGSLTHYLERKHWGWNEDGTRNPAPPRKRFEFHTFALLRVE